MSDITCRICGNEYTKRGMAQHVRSCAENHAGTGDAIYLRLRHDVYDPEHFLHLLVDADATVGRLDSFLRAIWLECCNHMSEVTLGRGRSVAMGAPIASVLPDGAEFEYTYDFGSSTRLEGRSFGEVAWPDEFAIPSPESNEPIAIVARNDPPDIPCDICGEPAQWVASMGWGGENDSFCTDHAVQAGLGFEMLLPVVNSPRMGVCGYTGSQWDDVDFDALEDAHTQLTSTDDAQQ